MEQWTPSEIRERWILHAGWECGWIPGACLVFQGTGDYHNEMNIHHFMEWFQILVPNFPACSVIVLDTAKYHNAVVVVDLLPALERQTSKPGCRNTIILYHSMNR